MMRVAEALTLVLDSSRPLPPVRVPVELALGLAVAEDVASDLDLPPFAKALMDGYAVNAADAVRGGAPLGVVEEITAGMMPTRALGPGEAARIMTGAPLPSGADAVVMSERTQLCDDGRVRLDEPALRAGLNVMPRGQEMQCGDIVLKAGMRVRPQECGLLAAVGRTELLVRPAPRVAVLATGDELVEPSVRPGPSQIRNSNGAMLRAQVRRAGAEPIDLGIAPDQPEVLRARIAAGLTADVLVLAGGVSAGKLDLVPAVLAELGVQPRFHKVAMKPGKPVLFGTAPRDDGVGPARLVFGLPGNPVGALIAFELFVRPALRTLLGLPPGPRLVEAALAEDFAHRTDRPTYRPARLWTDGRTWTVQPIAWLGSADLRSVTSANAFALLPEGERRFHAGESLPVLCVEEMD